MEEASDMIGKIAENGWYIPWTMKPQEYVPERLKTNG